MRRDFWVGDWEKSARASFSAGHDTETPVIFMDWTTALINGEQEYVDVITKTKQSISSASRGPPSGNSSNSGASGGG